MKKLLFLTILAWLMSCATVTGQDPNGVYFVVTSVSGKNFDRHHPGNVYRDTSQISRFSENYKNPPVMFDIRLDTYGGIDLWHYERARPTAGKTKIDEKDKHKVYLKEESFLNGVTCYKWEDFKNMEIKEWHTLMRSLVFGRTLYVVDRRDTQNGTIKIYQVANMSYR